MERGTEKSLEKGSERKRGLKCAALCLLLLLLLGGEVAVFLAEGIIYGRSPSVLPQHCMHWTLTAGLWVCGEALLYRMVKRKKLVDGPAFEEGGQTKPIKAGELARVLAAVAAGILFMTVAWEMRLKPVEEYAGMAERFGEAMAGVALFFQYLYYAAESGLILGLLFMGQQAGESLFHDGRKSHFPWGGIFCALTWGLPHIISKDLETALMG